MSLSKLLFIGLPGSGKGTQAKLLNFFHISTGDIIREAFAIKDPIISKYQHHIEKEGGLLPDELIFELIQQHTANLPQNLKGYILDGAIRTIPQAQYAVKNKIIDSVFYFSISEDDARKRIAGRRFKEDRKEDQQEVVEKRFKEYEEKTFPAIEYLWNHSATYSFPKYFRINSSRPIAVIHEEITNILEEI